MKEQFKKYEKMSLGSLMKALPALQKKKAPLSFGFYEQAVKTENANMAIELFKRGIQQDPRPYYRRFATDYLDKKLKRTQVQKFVTDNLLSIAKHQNLNERYVKFMSIDLEDEEKKKHFTQYKREARKKTRYGE